MLSFLYPPASSLVDEEPTGKSEKSFSRNILLHHLATSTGGEQVAFKQHNITAIQALAMSDWLLDVDARVMDAIKHAKERGFCSPGDAVIVVTGWVNLLHTLLSRHFSLSIILATRLWNDQYITYYLCRLDSRIILNMFLIRIYFLFFSRIHLFTDSFFFFFFPLFFLPINFSHTIWKR